MKLMRGVVEDNMDPEEIGRVKVRIFGTHTKNNENSNEDFNFIKTEDLPWSEVMGGNQFGLISGIGISSILRKGTWVWLILDHDDPNKPVIIGTVIGKNSEKLKYSDGFGFCDPDGKFPLESRVHTDGQSDIHPLAQSKYSDIAILETESGHLIEIDDRQDNKSIKVTHANKETSFVMDKDGNITINALGHDININSNKLFHNGTNVGDTHTHPQTDGNHHGGGTNTKSPK